MRYNTIISCDELQQNLDNPNFVIFDCQHDLVNAGFGRTAYTIEHIPGARFFSIDNDAAGNKTGKNGRHPLPPIEILTAKLGQLGVDSEKQVVVYDGSNNMFSVRLWWLLRWLGHESVAVLDGGLGKWQKDGRPVSAELPVPAATKFSATANNEMHVDAGFIQSHLGSMDVVVIDARAPERYTGAKEPLDTVAGHIPGAYNRFFKLNLKPDGTFKPADELRFEFEAMIGNTPPSLVVNQCGSGVTACHNLLAMEIAGFKGTKLYPGSWSEWCSDPLRPMAAGHGSLAA
jgi:thiosulfate/3-mercaptopyruvate sulfurtransferase